MPFTHSQNKRELSMTDQSDAIKLLDHGFVRLVDHMGDDLSIVRAARVSYDAAWRAGDDKGSDDRLIRYLWNNKHTTPFEAVQFTFEIKAPIFVFRQWHRHRTWSYNELSARYRELPEEFYVPEKLGIQSPDNKQGRVADERTTLETDLLRSAIAATCEQSFATYRMLLSRDVPRELARSVLPVNTYSHMFASVNLLNLLRFLTLRDDAHAQYEIRVYAEAMKKLIEPLVPVTMNVFELSRIKSED
jgi:thymidylate synthase (FAD)